MKETDRLKFAIGSLDLRRACDPGKSATAMLDRVTHILRDFLPFDIATFAEYAADDSSASGDMLVLGRYALDDGERFNWPARWLRVPSGIVDWINGKELAVPDVSAFFQMGAAFTDLRSNPVTQEYLSRNARSFVVSVLKQERKPIASLTLARKGGEPFTGKHQQILENLQLEETLRLVHAAYKMESATFHQEIRAIFAQCLEPSVVAEAAVKRLCQHFRWDYAAIFRLAHSRGRFELAQQYNASDKRLMVSEGYTQPFDKGVLGQVRKSGRPVRVESTSDGSAPGYIQIAPDARSCLCYPIVLDNGMEWILDCESSEVGAFQYPDEVELGALIKEAQNTIALWFEMRLNRALIENVEQGVIVVDEANRITRMNALASHLLGAVSSCPEGIASVGNHAMGRQPSSIWENDLRKFGADEEAKSILAAGHVAEKPLRLKGADGIERYVVASSRDAEDAFNRRIWRLTDPRGWDWVTALEYMRVTVQGVAQQTRGPLLLANALVAKARGLAEDNPDVRRLLSRARASLSKTDITYERLVAGLEIERKPLGSPVAVDIKDAIERFVGGLPVEDREAVTVIQEEHVPSAWADPDRVRFVLHSTVGYLLAIRAAMSTVCVRINGGPRHVAVELATGIRGTADIAVLPADPDPLARAKIDAQEATVHALSTVRKVIQSNGGSLKIHQKAGNLELRFTLPATSVARYGARKKGASDA